MNANKPMLLYVFFVIVALSLLISLIFVVRGARDLEHLIEIRNYGNETQGVIIKKTREPSVGRRIRYSYEVMDYVYESSSQVSAEAWDSLETGSMVTIRFDQNNPSHSILANYDKPIWGVGFNTLLWILISTLLAYALVRGFKNIQQQSGESSKI